jgi:hypothetical protein
MSDILVAYRVIYEVLDDGPLPAWSSDEVAFFLIALGGTRS